MHRDRVRAQMQIRNRRVQIENHEARVLQSRDCGAVIRQVARRNIRIHHLIPVDPDAETVVILRLERQRLNLRQIRHHKFPPHKHRAVAPLHVAQNRAQEILTISDCRHPHRPRRIVEARLPPGGRRIRCLRRPFQETPRRLRVDQSVRRRTARFESRRCPPAPAQTVVQRRIDQLDGKARQIAHRRPRKAQLIIDRLLHGARSVAQLQMIPLIAQLARPRPQCVAAELRLERRWIRRQHQIPLRGNHRPGGKSKTDPRAESPATEGHAVRVGIVQLDELDLLRVDRRRIMNLIDDHRADGPSRRRQGQEPQHHPKHSSQSIHHERIAHHFPGGWRCDTFDKSNKCAVWSMIFLSGTL